MPNVESNKTALIVSMLFNAYWFLCVVIQEQAWFILLALLIAAFVIDKTVVIVAPIIAFIGLSGDALLTGFGIFVFGDAVQTSNSARLGFTQALSTLPVWLAFLWVGFGTYAWLLRAVIKKYAGVFFIMLCSFSGASSYYAGMKLGSVQFSESLTITLTMLLALWATYGWLFANLINFFSTRVFREVGLNEQTSHESSLSVDLQQ